MPGGGHGESAGSREALTAALAQSPLPAQAQRDVVRLLFDKVDYLPGLSEADKRKRLSSMSYRDFMQQLVKMHPAAIDVFQKRTHPAGIAAVAAHDHAVVEIGRAHV